MGADILIVTIYLICVVSVLYQMALSVEAKLEDQVEIVLDSKTLEEAVKVQLAHQTRYQVDAQVIVDKAGSLLKLAFQHQNEGIGNIVFQVFPQGKRPLKPALGDLKIGISNGIPDQQVFINWDNSSLSVHGGVAHRAIRVVPGMPIDLFQPQVMTVVNPGQLASVAVTSERLFNRPENQTALQSENSLINFELVLGMKEPMRIYSLRMLTYVQSMTDPSNQGMQLLIPFNFQINVLPDHVALPIFNWLLKFWPMKQRRRTR